MSGTLTPSSVAFTLSGNGGGAGTLYRASSGVDGSYATEEELFLFGVSENVAHDFGNPGNALIQANLRRASRQADALICHRFKTPLNAYSEAWVGWVCDITAFFLMEVRGYQPGDEGRVEEGRFVRRYRTAMELIKGAQDYMLTPDKRLLGTENPQPATPASQGPTRNWLGWYGRTFIVRH